MQPCLSLHPNNISHSLIFPVQRLSNSPPRPSHAQEGPLATSAYTFYSDDSFSLEDGHNRLTLPFSVKVIITSTRQPVKPPFHKPTLMPHPTSLQAALWHNPDNMPSPLTTWNTIITFGFLFHQDSSLFSCSFFLSVQMITKHPPPTDSPKFLVT